MITDYIKVSFGVNPTHGFNRGIAATADSGHCVAIVQDTFCGAIAALLHQGMPYAPRLSRMTLRSVLCYAYKATSDPEFVAAAKRRQLELYPSYGDERNTLAQKVNAQPVDVIERMKQIMGN